MIDWVQSIVRSTVCIASFVLLQFLGYYIDAGGVWLCVIPLSGFILSGSFSAMHYSSHYTLYPVKWMNRWFGLAWSLSVLMNFSLYRYFHLKHHQFTSVAGDTEPAGEIRSIRTYLFYLLNWDFIFSFFRMSFGSLFGCYPEFVQTRLARQSVRRDALALTVFLVLLVFLMVSWPKIVVLSYLLPLQCALSFNFAITLGEHYGCDSHLDVKRSTRTFAIKSRLFKLFYWNSNYHTEHHLFPRARPWELPLIHVRESDRFKWISRSYLRFTICLLANLWKIETNESIKLPPGRRKDFLYPLQKR